MSLSVQQIANNSAFLPALASFGMQMKGVYVRNQRLAGNFGFHRRWLMSQAALALYLDPADKLTVSRLVDVLKDLGVASPNTIRDFMTELEAYHFIEQDPAFESRRPRYWRPLPVVIEVLVEWFAANLAILDRLDGQDRVSYFINAPDQIACLQPRFARGCIADRRWLEPPERVAFLQRSIAGGLVMDHIAFLAVRAERENGRFLVTAIDAHAIASEVQISRTHLQRTLKKVIEAGGLGWQGKAFESDMWVDGAFIDEYCGWQAVKSHHLSVAFDVLSQK